MKRFARSPQGLHIYASARKLLGMVDRWGDKIASFMSSKGKYVLCFILYVMFLYVYFFAICGITYARA